jgi:hypothetical protein
METGGKDVQIGFFSRGQSACPPETTSFYPLLMYLKPILLCCVILQETGNKTRNNKRNRNILSGAIWNASFVHVCPVKYRLCVYLILHQTLTEAAFKLKTFPMFSQSFTIRAAAISTHDGQNDNKFARHFEKNRIASYNEIACREFIGQVIYDRWKALSYYYYYRSSLLYNSSFTSQRCKYIRNGSFFWIIRRANGIDFASRYYLVGY